MFSGLIAGFLVITNSPSKFFSIWSRLGFLGLQLAMSLILFCVFF